MYSRYRSAWLLAAFAAVAGACGAEEEARPDTTTADVEPCTVALSVSPGREGVPTLEGTQFATTGGSGSFTFRFVDNASGGLIQASNGDYVAGPQAGGTDVIEVEDTVCGQVATASVQVYHPMSLVPPSAIVPPGTTFTLVNQGGSPDVTCTRLSDQTGGALEGCTWTAGPTEGIDEIEVVDAQTGERGVVLYASDAAAAIEMVGERLFLPLDQGFTFEITGGTQVYEVVPSSPALVLEEPTRVRGTEPGTFSVTVTDRFAPALTTTFSVEVVAPHTAPLVRDGEGTDWAEVRGADLNRDGFDDAVVSSMEASVGAHFSGAVHVYAGSASGLAAEPVLTLTHPQSGAFVGRALALGDVDGDGEVDLVVGSDGWDSAASGDVGRVDVFRGLAGGFVDTTPAWTAVGPSPAAHLGASLAVCDVNGDGIDDIAAGGFGLSDPADTRANEGGVHVFYGSATGPSGTPDVEVYSQSANFQMGRRLAGGHTDGDALCDLVAASWTRALDGAGEDGIVWRFRGADLTSGVAPVLADRTYTSDEDDLVAQLGRFLILEDIDEDGLDDLFVGAWRANRGGDDRGAVYLFREADHSTDAAVVTSRAFATVEGEIDGARLGQAATWGRNSLWVGALGTGALYRFGVAGLGGVTTTASADDVWVGPTVDDRFGAAVGYLGDDGAGGEAVVVATRDPTYGVQVGAPYVVSDGGLTRLEFPGEASGGGFGTSGTLGFIDHDGNGVFDLLAGTPGAPSEVDINAGAVQWWSGFDDRWGPLPNRGIDAVPGGASRDRLGAALASAGDFDGNGVEDLVVIQGNGDRPAVFDPRVVNPEDCPGPLADAGAAWVFSGASTAEPMFVIYGFAPGAGIAQVAGGFDVDRDGFDDLVFGNPGDGAEGGVTLVHGRSSQAGSP